MVQEISEAECPTNQPEEIETTFRTLSDGDTVTVYAWGGGDTYIKSSVTINSTHHSTDEVDDYVTGSTETGDKVKLRLPWYPAEPNVGIPKPYSEGPIRFEYDDGTYDISALEVTE